MTHFDLQTFRRLKGQALMEFMSPIVNDANVRLSMEDLAGLEDGWEQFDEVHLVYAIELGTRLAPARFANLLPPLLCHESWNVRSAAGRAIVRLPKHLISEDYVKLVAQEIGRCKDGASMDWLLDSLLNQRL